MDKKARIVFPGEFITTEEEFAPGRNTFEEGGIIRASIIGEADFDDLNKEVKVKGKSITKLRTGDIVTAKIMSVRESKVSVGIVSVENETLGKKVLSVMSAMIPVRNVSNAYVTDLTDFFKVGDIIRAKVAMANDLAVDLQTNEKGLGVIKAYCHNCRKELSYNGGKLMCLNCGNVEERKWFEAEDVRGERRDFGGERRGFGGGGRRDFGGDRRSFGGERRGFGDRGGERRFGSRDAGGRGFGGRPREERNFGGGRSFDADDRSQHGFGRGGSGRNFGGHGERKDFGSHSDKRAFVQREARFEKDFKNDRKHFSGGSNRR
ncbi:MAG: exosome complex RNA-binding protein Csl4 [Candidatus Diapherotrites archaeon]|nr:exosome complex RNA-binding protein Csl4 [Candidatus Diapherotrites archaeon]